MLVKFHKYGHVCPCFLVIKTLYRSNKRLGHFLMYWNNEPIPEKGAGDTPLYWQMSGAHVMFLPLFSLTLYTQWPLGLVMNCHSYDPLFAAYTAWSTRAINDFIKSYDLLEQQWLHQVLWSTRCNQWLHQVLWSTRCNQWLHQVLWSSRAINDFKSYDLLQATSDFIKSYDQWLHQVLWSTWAINDFIKSYDLLEQSMTSSNPVIY